MFYWPLFQLVRIILQLFRNKSTYKQVVAVSVLIKSFQKVEQTGM